MSKRGWVADASKGGMYNLGLISLFNTFYTDADKK